MCIVVKLENKLGKKIAKIIYQYQLYTINRYSCGNLIKIKRYSYAVTCDIFQLSGFFIKFSQQNKLDRDSYLNYLIGEEYNNDCMKKSK